MSTIIVQTDACLSFKIGTEIFAASVAHVNEILELTRITRVPHAPSFMIGVTNLRGAVLPVIDTRAKFGFPETAATPDTCIIVLNLTAGDKPILIGALVDAVVEVFDVAADAIKPLPPFGSRYRTDFITGTIKAGDEFIMLLDIEKVFTTAELAQIHHTDMTDTGK